MQNSSPLCVDASILVRLVTVARANPVSQAWDRWQTENRRIVAPRLALYEVTNAFHQMRRAGQLNDLTAQGTLRAMLDQPIDFYDDESLHSSALHFSSRFNRPASYDSHYLALAELLAIEFWTLDERLYNAVRHQLPWVRLLGSTA
jgi:predicted nucleic acid-binding protein